jgi:uncharacterized RDD family membrane protein YckC
MMYCTNCGAETPDSAKFCGKCGASLSTTKCPLCGEAIPPGSKVCTHCVPQLNKHTTVYAGFWIRLVAWLIDIAIWLVVGIILILILGRSLGTVFALIFLAGYYTYFESSEKQATLGKQAMGIKVVNKDGGRISWSSALGRALIKMLPMYSTFVLAWFGTMIFMISLVIDYGIFLTIPISSRKQAVYDMIMDTYVVKGRQVKNEPTPVVKGPDLVIK